MIHELFALIASCPLGSLIVILSLIWATERVATAFINRNKPDVDCERDCECDCDEKEEVVAMGGQSEEHEDQK